VAGGTSRFTIYDKLARMDIAVTLLTFDRETQIFDTFHTIDGFFLVAVGTLYGQMLSSKWKPCTGVINRSKFRFQQRKVR